DGGLRPDKRNGQELVDQGAGRNEGLIDVDGDRSRRRSEGAPWRSGDRRWDGHQQTILGRARHEAVRPRAVQGDVPQGGLVERRDEMLEGRVLDPVDAGDHEATRTWIRGHGDRLSGPRLDRAQRLWRGAPATA